MFLYVLNINLLQRAKYSATNKLEGFVEKKEEVARYLHSRVVNSELMAAK